MTYTTSLKEIWKKLSYKLNASIDDLGFSAPKEKFFDYLAELKGFDFNIFNPLFWAAVFILFLLLSRAWSMRKSFSFCVIITIILLSATKIEQFIQQTLGISPEGLTPCLIRIFAAFVIIITSFYYTFMKD